MDPASIFSSADPGSWALLTIIFLNICLVKLSLKRILENGDGTRRSAGEVSSPCARRRIKRRLGRVWLKLEARHLSLGRSARPVFLSTATACPALSAIHPAHPSSTWPAQKAGMNLHKYTCVPQPSVNSIYVHGYSTNKELNFFLKN